MKNLPSLYELLAHEKATYDKRRKSARAFYKFYGFRNVKPIGDKEENGRPAGDYYFVDGIEYMAVSYDLYGYRIFLMPLLVGPRITKEF